MAYLALYRRYRPQKFDDVVGQDYVIQILKNQILSQRIGHAYLFSGIRGTGKTSIAKIFARAVNCENNQDGNPCGSCRVCQTIEKSGILDIIEIDAASNRGVDEIREIREKVKFPPTVGRYKVYIIDEVHMLTKEAFNALLKTLEEPPEHVIFILATTEPNKLPATILSRCQRFDIRPIAPEAIEKQIQKILDDIGVAMEPEAVSVIAYRGDRSMRDALSLLDQVIDIRKGNAVITKEAVMDFIGMAENDEITALSQGIIDDDAASVLMTFQQLMGRGLDAALVFNQIIQYFRKLLIVLTTGESAKTILSLPDERIAQLRIQAEHLGEARLFGMVDFMIEERPKLTQSGLATIVAEMTLLRLVQQKDWQKKAEPVQNNRSVQPENKSHQRYSPAPAHQRIPATDRSDPPAINKEQENQQTVSVKPAKAAAPVEDQTAANVDRIYQAMLTGCQKNKPMAVGHLRQGRLVQKDKTSIVLYLNPDNEAGLNLLRMPIVFNYLQDIVSKTAGEKTQFSIELVKKTYETMSMYEKTKEIINDNTVEIVEIE